MERIVQTRPTLSCMTHPLTLISKRMFGFLFHTFFNLSSCGWRRWCSSTAASTQKCKSVLKIKKGALRKSTSHGCCTRRLSCFILCSSALSTVWYVRRKRDKLQTNVRRQQNVIFNNALIQRLVGRIIPASFVLHHLFRTRRSWSLCLHCPFSTRRQLPPLSLPLHWSCHNLDFCNAPRFRSNIFLVNFDAA